MEYNIPGHLLKEIRLGKGIRQADICGNQISRAGLSKIENNRVIPNYATFSYLLNELNLSFDEFEFLSQQENSKKKILSMFWKITNNTEVEQLKMVIRLCNEYLAKNKDSLILDIQSLSEILLSSSHSSMENFNGSIKVDLIWKRINKMDLWTINELKLAGCILFYFPFETAINIADRVEKELSRYEHFEPIQTFISSLYINLSTLCMQNFSFSLAQIFNEKAAIISKNVNRYDYYFFCMVRKGIYQKNEDFIQSGLIFLEQIGKHEVVQVLKGEIQQHFPEKITEFY